MSAGVSAPTAALGGRGSKLVGDHVRALGAFYGDTPKAVFAAIAFSLASVNGDPEEAQRVMLREWTALYDNGIVPQKPPQRVEADL